MFSAWLFVCYWCSIPAWAVNAARAKQVDENTSRPCCLLQLHLSRPWLIWNVTWSLLCIPKTLSKSWCGVSRSFFRIYVMEMNAINAKQIADKNQSDRASKPKRSVFEDVGVKRRRYYPIRFRSKNKGPRGVLFQWIQALYVQRGVLLLGCSFRRQHYMKEGTANFDWRSACCKHKHKNLVRNARAENADFLYAAHAKKATL